MRMQIESDCLLPSGANDWIKDKARLVFSPHAGQIRRIRIQLRQAERSEATVTVWCREVRTVATERTAVDPLRAYGEAADQAARLLKSRLRLKRALAETEAG